MAGDSEADTHTGVFEEQAAEKGLGHKHGSACASREGGQGKVVHGRPVSTDGSRHREGARGDLSESEVEQEVKEYLHMHGLSDIVHIKWLDKNVCSVPSMRTRVDQTAGVNAVVGTLHLVQGVPMKRSKLRSLLDHEVGTHFLRAYHQNVRAGLPALRIDASRSAHGHWKASTVEDLETEEGLATVNTHISTACKVLWSPALSYYVQCRARDLGFTDLFLELRQFVPSAASRWSFCVRSKRGLRDTAVCGALAKDRVYFEGAIKILLLRKALDFRVLHSGKVSHICGLNVHVMYVCMYLCMYVCVCCTVQMCVFVYTSSSAYYVSLICLHAHFDTHTRTHTHDCRQTVIL
jgi:hypothetical protein